MPIKFPCPHCKKVLNVKDHLAGKKGPCPACKKILTVPQASTTESAAAAAKPEASAITTHANGRTKPKEQIKAEKPAAPPIDAEAAAAAAFADEPPPVEETKTTTTLEFNCPYCDEPLKLSTDLAGKRAPCPECKHIIKVPELKTPEKADWRKTNAAGLPSGARRPDQPVPEGAWGSVASAGTVSREALEEADVLPDRYRRPLTTQQKIARGVTLVTTAAVFLFLAGGAFAWWSSSREARTLKNIEDYARAQAALDNRGRERAAALYVALGEYRLRAKKAGSAQEAQVFFNKAIETLSAPSENAAADNERDALLAELAVLQVELGGSRDEEAETLRLSGNDAQSAVGKTLRTMHHSPVRLEAYRTVCRRLIAKKQGNRALALASQLSDAPADKMEANCIAALELLAAKDQKQADRAAEGLSGFATEKEAERPPLTPSVAALLIVLKREPLKPTLLTEQENNAIGQAEGRARLGDWDGARETAGKIANAGARLQAFTALAAVGDAKSDNPDLKTAIDLATGELKPKGGLGWLKLRIADLAARAGAGNDQIEAIAAAMEDRSLASRARLAALRQRLAAGQKGDDAPLLAESPPTLSHYLAREMVARKQRSYNGKAAAASDLVAEQNFGVIGVLLGGVD